MNIERARKKDFAELMDVMHRAFAADRPGFERFEELFPDLYRPASEAMQNLFVIRSNGRIASVAGLFPIMLAIGPVRLRIAGIGGVCTVPEHRGKGAMSALMTHILQEARQAGYAVAWLSGLRRRYARFGFERAGSAVVVRILRKPEDQRPSPWHITQVTPEGAALHTIISLRGSLALRGLCDDETYRIKLSRKHVEVWFASLGEARAYIVVHRKNNWCLEWGGEVEGVRALLLHLAAAGTPWLLRLSPFRDEYTDMLLDLSEQYEGSQDCLAVLHPTRLLKEYQPLLAWRWPEGKALSLIVNDRPDLSFHLANSRVVRRSVSGASQIRLPAAHLSHLLFGPTLPDALLDLPQDQLWLRHVFPLPFAMPGLWRV